MKHYIITLLVVSAFTFGIAKHQGAVVTHQVENITFSAPALWDLDTSKRLGTTFFLFSPLEGDEDPFRENVNLMIQDVSQYDLDLKAYMEVTEQQLEMLITNLKLIKSEIQSKDGLEYGVLEYTGKQGTNNLHWLQRVYINNGDAYIFTGVARQAGDPKYPDYIRYIFNSVNIQPK